MILNADGFTREFLEQEGQPLGPELVLPEDPVPKCGPYLHIYMHRSYIDIHLYDVHIYIYIYICTYVYIYIYVMHRYI
jgi:hypothetical protein